MPTKLAPLAALAVVFAAVVGAYVVAPGASSVDRHPADDRRPPDDYGFGSSDADPPTPEAATMTTFESAAAFAEYVWTARMQTGGHGPPVVATDGAVERAGGRTATPMATATAAPARAPGGTAKTEDGGPRRYSETNVQEEGIDEPDVVKTDGRHIYYAERTRGHHHPAKRRDDDRDGETRVVDATPPGTADLAADIDHSGRLFLAGDRLVVIGEDVWGYDVSNASDPELEWTRELSDRVQTARLRNGTLYLVLASRVDAENPCPIEPLEGATVECTEVYHPDRPVRVDATYTALTLDPATGDVGDELSFVGARDATVYMSDDGLYATYTEQTPRASVRLDFLLTDARPLLDDWVVSRLEEVRGYDLSPRATEVEVRQTLERWFRSLDDHRREEVRRELRDRYEDYVEDNRRKLTTTHVVRIAAGSGTTDGTAGRATGGTGASLSMAGTGAVPGRPLNQFSLDTHDGHLRIATTVGERWDTESVNDVYVLDATNLSVTGSVTGMGETERIYAVRFVGDRGYVVTFRRIDPFHVLDLSDPSDPTMEGELKLPGYSSYLHPLSGDRVLGIGEEDGEVKVVTFDVSDPSDPTVDESRVLAADWSAVSRTHHAFLLDRRHGVFFLPTERGGKVLSATDLDTVHTVAVDDPRRALYIDDYLYVFGDDEVAVVNENDWTRTETLDLE